MTRWVRTNRPTIIGIAGAMRAGKDTVAQRLVEHWGYTRLGFADLLKEEVSLKFTSTLLAIADATLLDLPDDDLEAVQRLLTEKPPIIRALLQEYGTEVRRADDPDYWLDQWDARWVAMRRPRVVIPDVRFENEAWHVWGHHHGELWFVIRPGYPRGGHASETTLADKEQLAIQGQLGRAVALANDGTVEDLWNLVDSLLAVPPLLSASRRRLPSGAVARRMLGGPRPNAPVRSAVAASTQRAIARSAPGVRPRNRPAPEPQEPP